MAKKLSGESAQKSSVSPTKASFERSLVKKLSELSGVTIRTLHFYEEADLLKPAYYGSNGYRYYEEKELLQLQQILFFKELGFTLK